MHKYSWLFVLLLLAACSGSSEEKSQANEGGDAVKTEAVAESSEPVVVELAEHNVLCGCAVEGVGACGNYIEVNGNFVAIANWEEMGLGSMEWCGKQGMVAEASGEVKDGKFYAVTLAEAHTH